MNYILLAVLIAEAAIIYVLNGKKLVSPSFVSCAVFIFSTLAYIIGADIYDHNIRINTIAVITLMILCIFIGESIINMISAKDTGYIRIKESKKAIVIPRYLCAIIVLFVAAVGFIYFKSVYEYSLTIGNSAGNYIGMARYVRFYGDFKSGLLLGQAALLSECLFYFFVYSTAYNKAVTGKFFFRYLFMLPAYAIHIFSVNDRITLLRIMIISLIIIFFVVKQSAMWSRKYDLRIIITTAVIIAVFLVLFRLLGYRTGVSNDKNVFSNIVVYCSSGLYGLDIFVYGEIIAENSLFSQRTFLGIYELLQSWGFLTTYDIPHVDVVFYFGTGTSNIYTGIKGLIQDYSLFGAGVFLIMWGMILTLLINGLKYRKFNFVKLIILSMLFYPVIMISIDFVFSATIRTTFIYMIIYSAVIVWLADIFRDKKYDGGKINAFS